MWSESGTGSSIDSHPLPERVLRICCDAVEADLTPDTDLFTYGLNSLALVRIVAALERDCGIRLSAVDIYDNPTATQIVALLHQRRAGSHG